MYSKWLKDRNCNSWCPAHEMDSKEVFVNEGCHFTPFSHHTCPSQGCPLCYTPPSSHSPNPLKSLQLPWRSLKCPSLLDTICALQRVTICALSGEICLSALVQKFWIELTKAVMSSRRSLTWNTIRMLSHVTIWWYQSNSIVSHDIWSLGQSMRYWRWNSITLRSWFIRPPYTSLVEWCHHRE